MFKLFNIIQIVYLHVISFYIGGFEDIIDFKAFGLLPAKHLCLVLIFWGLIFRRFFEKVSDDVHYI
jgi:hypothetical protein